MGKGTGGLRERALRLVGEPQAASWMKANAKLNKLYSAVFPGKAHLENILE